METHSPQHNQLNPTVHDGLGTVSHKPPITNQPEVQDVVNRLHSKRDDFIPPKTLASLTDPTPELNKTLKDHLEPLETKQHSLPDLINHPPHYNAGPIESIDAIESMLTNSPLTHYQAFLQATIKQYIWRVGRKTGEGVTALQDAKKAKWYLDRLIDSLTDYPPKQ